MLCYEVFSLPLSFGMFRQIADIIPASFRRRSVTAAVTILLRAVLNFFGIALLVPLLMLILDGDAIHSHHVLQRVYEALGFTDDNHFIVTVAAGVVAAIIVKGAADMLLYRSERDYIFGLYRNLSRRLYIDYHRRGLEFVLRNNSSELSRNVNIVCLNFVVGVLRPIAVIAGEALLFLLIIVVLAVFQPLTAVALVVILTPAVWLYYRIIRRRMENYGKQENEAQRAKFRNVAESFRGYADVEINNAFPRMLSAFDEATERVIAMRKRDASLALLPQIFTETAPRWRCCPRYSPRRPSPRAWPLWSWRAYMSAEVAYGCFSDFSPWRPCGSCRRCATYCRPIRRCVTTAIRSTFSSVWAGTSGSRMTTGACGCIRRSSCAT